MLKWHQWAHIGKNCAKKFAVLSLNVANIETRWIISVLWNFFFFSHLGLPREKKNCIKKSLLEWNMYQAVPAISQRLGECPCCFEPLATEPVVMLKQRSGRHCPHYLHARCARSQPPKGACMVCNQPYVSIEPFPDISDHAAWFAAIDIDNDKRLSQPEVVAALKATVRGLDWERLSGEINGLWANWDVNGDGYITYDEIFRPNYGFLAYVQQQYAGRSAEYQPPPPLSDSFAWFTFWDTDRSNTLDKAEVHRALVKTFDLEGDPSKTTTMGSTLNAVWPIFDLDNNGTIDRSEFSSPDGLGPTLAANLAHMKRRTTAQVVVAPPHNVSAPPAMATVVSDYQGDDDAIAVAVVEPVGYDNAVQPAGYGGGAAQPSGGIEPPEPPPPDYLPPNWEERVTPEGQLYYSNSVLRTTQWERPRL